MDIARISAPVEILFRTVHGSTLYGLATEHSDLDYYTVIPTKSRARKRYAKQTIHDGLDSTVLDFSTFRVYCDIGVPQTLEALFSPVAEIDYIADFRRSYRIDTAAVMERYRRTIKSFSLNDDFKRRRHALRLCLNLREALQKGRFNPQLSDRDKLMITQAAASRDYYEILENLHP